MYGPHVPPPPTCTPPSTSQTAQLYHQSSIQLPFRFCPKCRLYSPTKRSGHGSLTARLCQQGAELRSRRRERSTAPRLHPSAGQVRAESPAAPPPRPPRPPYTPRCVCDATFPQAAVAGPGSKPRVCRYIQRCSFLKEATRDELIFEAGGVTATEETKAQTTQSALGPLPHRQPAVAAAPALPPPAPL